MIVNGVVDTDALDQAISDINALGSNGGTNYEAGLGTAAGWISGNLVVPITQFTEDDHNLATGGGNTDNAALLKGADGTTYALVSGWGPTLGLADLRDANGDTSDGWGVQGTTLAELDPDRGVAEDHAGLDGPSHAPSRHLPRGVLPSQLVRHVGDVRQPFSARARWLSVARFPRRRPRPHARGSADCRRRLADSTEPGAPRPERG